MNRFLVVLSIFLFACAPKPPNVTVCEYLAQRLSNDPVSGHLMLTPSPTCMREIGESECAHCIKIVSGEEFFIGEQTAHRFNGKPWSMVKQESIYLPAQESYAPLAAYIIDSCKKLSCSDQVTGFKIKLDSLNGIIPALSNP